MQELLRVYTLAPRGTSITRQSHGGCPSFTQYHPTAISSVALLEVRIIDKRQQFRILSLKYRALQVRVVSCLRLPHSEPSPAELRDDP